MPPAWTLLINAGILPTLYSLDSNAGLMSDTTANNVHSVQISHFFRSHKMVSIFETFANPANCRMQIKYQFVSNILLSYTKRFRFIYCCLIYSKIIAQNFK